MKLKYEAKKRNRIKYNFIMLEVYDSNDELMWFNIDDWDNYQICKYFDKCYSRKDLEKNKKQHSLSSSSFRTPQSPKAFIRWINKHTEIPKGAIITLISRYVGHNIIYKKK